MRPGSIKRTTPLEIVEVAPGLFVATNAYEGDFWEYFEGRPIPMPKGDEELND